MIETTCTPPVFGFVCLSVPRMFPFKTCLGENPKMLVRQTREDNAKDKATMSFNDVWEYYCFVFGFPSFQARVSFFNYLKIRCVSNHSPGNWNAPLLLKKRIKHHSKNGSMRLKFVKCICLKKLILENFLQQIE